MLYDYLVKIPDAVGVRYSNRWATRNCCYVYYRFKSADKDGSIIYNNILIGRRAEGNPKLMVPNSNFYRYFKDLGERFSKEYDKHLVERKKHVKEAYDILTLADPTIATKMVGYEGIISDHDISKYSDEEYTAFDHYLYGEPTVENKIAYDYAMLHHQHNNPHHWEYWLIFENDATQVKALEMPYHYVVEMVCDWYSFTMTGYGRFDINDWNDTTYYLHPKTEELVNHLLTTLDDALKTKQIDIHK